MEVWKGNYCYRLEDGSASINFGFQFYIERENGNFEGFGEDDEYSSVTDQKFTIKGFILGDMISFVKTYPFGFYMDENGKYKIDENQRNPTVNYTGWFDEEKGLWSGEWEFVISSNKVGYLDEYNEEFIMGHWEMSTNEYSLGNLGSEPSGKRW